MSEYQCVAFRAIDGPVSDKNMDYMEKQSSRAEMTRWSFDNEYHYSSFRGNAIEMLRRGYDIHLDYSNYGGRSLMIRLPRGLPDPVAAKPYFVKGAFEFLKDPKGPGGILSLKPFYEELDGEYELEGIIDELIPLRAEILDGDLRPLYLAHLLVALDDNHDPAETHEGPVPAGLSKPTEAQIALMSLYNFGKHIINAAARSGPRPPLRDDITNRYSEWIQKKSEATKNPGLVELLSNPESTIRREIIAGFQKECRASSWPTVQLNRTISQLMDAEQEISTSASLKSAAAAEKARKKKLAQLAADPAKALRQPEELIKLRGTETYRQIAELLADVREALAQTERAGLAEKQAQKLKEANPTLNGLIGALRNRGFLPKQITSKKPKAT